MESCRRSLVLLVASVFVVFLASGCAPAVRDVVHAGTPAAVDSTLRVIEEPSTRERIEDLAQTEEMQRTMREVGKQIAEGMKISLEGSQFSPKAQELLSQMMVTATRSAVQAAMAEASSPANQAKVQQMVVDASVLATRSALQTVAGELPSTLGPPVSAMLEKQMADPDARRAMDSLVFELSRQAVLGSDEGLKELARKKDNAGALAKASAWAQSASWLLPLLGAALLASIVLLAVGLIRSRNELTRVRQELEARHSRRTARAEDGPHPSRA
jgi:hypothetical protein